MAPYSASGKDVATSQRRLQLAMRHLAKLHHTNELYTTERSSEAMGDLKETLAKGVEEGKIPHAVVCATNRDGEIDLQI